MVRSRCRRGRRIAKLRGMARQTVRAVMSIASLAAGIAALGFGVAGTSIAILDLTSGGVVEGRSVAGGSASVVIRSEGMLHAGPERWEPRGKVWICRSWCEKGKSACTDVCGPGAP
jgi:hypothetical protein